MEQNLSFDLSGAVKLYGILVDKSSRQLVILLHPYGPLGGDCHNPVITSLSNSFNTKGYSTLRFDMRGSGLSSGRTSWNGQPECNDLIEICKDPHLGLYQEIILVGYSYGSVIACFAASSIKNLKMVVSIAYPTFVLWAVTAFNQKMYLDGLEGLDPDLPKLFVIGDKDNFTSLQQWESMLDKAAVPQIDRIVLDSDHFFNTRRELEMLVDAVQSRFDQLKFNAD